VTQIVLAEAAHAAPPNTMKILSWNYRGLENPRTVRDLCLMVKEKRPEVVFLIETKCRSAKMEQIRVRIGFEGLFVVDLIGKSGGLALLWRESNTLEIQNYSRWHINAVMKEFEGRGTMETNWVLWTT
jgi:exonuclease III